MSGEYDDPSTGHSALEYINKVCYVIVQNIEVQNTMAIDWQAFDSKYVKIDDKYKELVLTSWNQTVREGTPGQPGVPALNFTVIQEDGKALSTPKIFQVTTRDLIDKLKPLVMAAETSKKAFITVSIARVEKGKYSVKEVTANAN